MIRTEIVRPVGDLVRRQAAEHGDAVAVSDPSRSVRFAELDQRTSALAAALGELQVRHGQRVVLFMANSVALVEALLAVVRADAVAVCVSVASTAEELRFLVHDSTPQVVVTDPARIGLVVDCLADLPDASAPQVVVSGVGVGDRHHTLERLIATHAGADAPDGLLLDEPAWMLYTSGTTGRPKGVLLSQRNMLWVAASAWLPFLELDDDDVALNPLPLSHSYPLDMTLAVLAAGGRTHLLERFTASEIIQALRAQRATFLLCVPTTVTFLLNAVEQADLDITAFPRLRFLLSAGAVAPAAISQRVEQVLSIPLLDAYGSTEAATAIVLNAVRGGHIPGSCGVPAPGWAVRVVDFEGRDVPVGEEGELIARGPGLMLGYHQRPEETARVVHDGWYWSGDLAYQDQNGYVTISGRLKDIIIRGGENIAPAEIENVLLQFPGVVDCAATGRPDELYGEIPVAFVVKASDSHVSTQELHAWCADRLAAFKVPAEIRFVDEIAKTASGKVKRYLLQ